MIPRRISLSGFLSYREEQTFDFDGAPICMLSGPNGSGKSSVFDAVTFALYGAHRGGQQGAGELITKGRDALRVEFDFEVAGAQYRIQRSARRKGGPTRQAFHADPVDGWRAIPDTHLEAGFDAWVRDLVGLTYEAFTSSVLLLQGRAEKLISARPADRLVVLKEIVGLDRFERLHARVTDQSRAAALRAEDHRARLNGIPAVEDEELARAQTSVTEAEAARASALATVDRLIGLEHQARDAARLRAEADDLRAWLDRARATLADADAIDLGMNRLADLRAALPLLESALNHRRTLAQIDAAARTQHAELARLEAESASADTDRQALGARLETLQASIPAAERDFEALRDALAEAARLVDRARRCQRVAAQVADLAEQLAQAPADLDGRIEALASDVDRLDTADRALPPLKRLAHARGVLQRVREEAESTRAALAGAEADAGHARAALDDATARHAEADAEHRRAEPLAEAARIARATALRARTLLDDLANLPECDRCGQPLTPAHLADERSRRDAEVAAAQEQYQAARTAAAAATRALKVTQAALDAARHRLDEATKSLAALTTARDRHARDLDREALDCASAFAELPAPFRPLVAPGTDESEPIDWPATTYPSPAELAALRRAIATLPDARRQLAEARAAHQRRAVLVEKLADARRTLAEESAGLPDDLAAPLRDQEQIAARVRVAKTHLDALRADVRRADADLGRHRQAQDARAAQIAELSRSLAAAAGRREATLAALDRDRLALPEPWRPLADAAPPEHARTFRRELEALERDGIEARADRLREARTQAEPRRSRLADLDRQLAEVPADALRPPAELTALLVAARADRDRLDRALIDAGRALDQLRRHRADRLALAADALAADKAASTAGRLAELLGPRHLQRHLVREAEEGILRFADDLLDRLSGGQLTLRLRKADPESESRFDRALDLEAYNRETKQAIAVPFLSGSQRFRVAVALALGIGRYAGRLHRPIESVIIDEGFGCLDREGLSVMIRELQNLREHVRRIILVSHQDELAAAFAEGYKLEVIDGTTVATRFSA